MYNNKIKIKEFINSGTPKANLTKIILCAISISAIPLIVVGAGAMGNAVQIFRQFNTNKKYTNKKISDTFTYLRRNKLIEYVSDKNGITTVKITNKGNVKLKSYSIDFVKISNPKKWDGKWRMVMFDLPIRYSKARDSLRLKLKQLGFVQFQKSVWIYPYPCFDEILFIADYYKVGNYVEIMTVTDINNDIKFKKHFRLI